MADPAVVLLAAGLSRRYGAVGKLVANYRGKPLALHIADTLNASVAHLNTVIDASRNGATVASATEGGPPTPPAIFPKTRYPELLALEGDKGARALLGDAQLVLASAAELADFDTPQDFAN